MIEAALRHHLMQSVPIVQMVETRVTCDDRPQHATLPAIVISRVSGDHRDYLGGGAGRCEARLQIDCFAAKYLDAKRLAEFVRQEWQGYSGTIGAGVEVTAVFGFSDIDVPNPPQDNSDDVIYQVACDCTVHFRETIPTF